MIKIIMKSVIFSILITLSYASSSQEIESPYPEPANLAQKIANYTQARDQSVIIFDNYDVYTVFHGSNTLFEISHYRTNMYFSDQPELNIISILEGGRIPRIYSIKRYWDVGAHSKVNLFEQYTSRHKDRWFLPTDINDRFWTDKFIVELSVVTKNGKTHKFTQADREKLNTEYAKLLVKIAKLLNIE